MEIDKLLKNDFGELTYTAIDEPRLAFISEFKTIDDSKKNLFNLLNEFIKLYPDRSIEFPLFLTTDKDF